MRLIVTLFSLMLSLNAWADNPEVVIKTSQGTIVIELYPDKAPKTVENFLNYVRNDFYKGTIFHRVVDRFVIQGGGYTADLKPKDTLPPIASEATNGLNNDAGMVAMARSAETNSATSQFFINVQRNLFLNHHRPHPDYYGYAVFAKVVQGMDVVEKIAALKTTSAGPFFTDVPVQNVTIDDVQLVVPEVAAEPVPTKPKSKPKKKTKSKKSKNVKGR